MQEGSVRDRRVREQEGERRGGKERTLDARSVSREDLLLQSTDGEDLTVQGDLSSHSFKKNESERRGERRSVVEVKRTKRKGRAEQRDSPISGSTLVFVNKLTNATKIALPALGPSFPIPPSGI